MKKLLKVLTVVGFSALAVAPVVACEKKDNKTPNKDDSSNQNNNSNNKQKNELIQKFNNEVRNVYNGTVRPFVISRTAFLSKDSENKNFFSRESLYELDNEKNVNKDSDGYHSFYENLVQDRKNEFEKTLRTVLDVNSAVNKFKEKILSLGVDKYRTILGGFNNNKWIKGIKFRLTDSKMKFFEEKGSFDSTIQVGLDFQYQYKDSANQIKTETISDDFVINISSEEAIIKLVNDIKKSWVDLLLLDSNNLLKVDFERLKRFLGENQVLTAQDLLTTVTNNYKSAISKYNEVLAEEVREKISKYFIKNSENKVVKNLLLSFKDQNQKTDVEKNNTELNIGPLERSHYNAKGESGTLEKDSYDLLHLYFGEVKNGQEINLLNTKTGDEQLAKDLINPWVEKMANYKTEFKQTLADIASGFVNEDKLLEFNDKLEKDNVLKDLFKSSTSIESFDLKGLQLKLENGYVHDLGNISFSYVVEIDKNDEKLNFENLENLKSEGYKKSAVFDAYYKGIEVMLDQFHKFYGIQKAHPDYETSELSYPLKRLLFNMTGKPSSLKDSENSDFNIWDEWEKYLNQTENNRIDDWTSFYSLDFDVDVKKVKEEHLISNMLGIKNFKVFQDQAKQHEYEQEIYYENESYQRSYEKNNLNVTFPKGIVTKGRRNTHLEFGLLTDLLNFKLKVAEGFTYYTLGAVTIIGKLDDQNGNQDGNKPDGNQDGNKPDGNQDGNKPDGNQDGNKPDGNQDGNKPDGNQDGNKPDGNQDGNKPDGNQDGNKPDGNQDGNKPDGNQDGNNQK
ncbi:hypothetical protein V2P43_01590 [Mycoplasma capricolum subsp. capricolum]|uniref:hypothetical protein n=1 Tax=Mycoplasma capricolum TaxID=2095 RepID=UPI003DA3C821